MPEVYDLSDPDDSGKKTKPKTVTKPAAKPKPPVGDAAKPAARTPSPPSFQIGRDLTDDPSARIKRKVRKPPDPRVQKAVTVLLGIAAVAAILFIAFRLFGPSNEGTRTGGTLANGTASPAVQVIRPVAGPRAAPGRGSPRPALQGNPQANMPVLINRGAGENAASNGIH